MPCQLQPYSSIEWLHCSNTIMGNPRYRLFFFINYKSYSPWKSLFSHWASGAFRSLPRVVTAVSWSFCDESSKRGSRSLISWSLNAIALGTLRPITLKLFTDSKHIRMKSGKQATPRRKKRRGRELREHQLDDQDNEDDPFGWVGPRL